MLDEVTETALTPAARLPINLRRVTSDKVMKSKKWVPYECNSVIAKTEQMEDDFSGLRRNIFLTGH
jgi:hypothetical protein